MIKELFLMLTVVNLLVVGVFITLRSGIVGGTTSRRVLVLSTNLGSMVLRVAGYLVGLVIVQRAVGLPLTLKW